MLMDECGKNCTVVADGCSDVLESTTSHPIIASVFYFGILLHYNPDLSLKIATKKPWLGPQLQALKTLSLSRKPTKACGFFFSFWPIDMNLTERTSDGLP